MKLLLFLVAFLTLSPRAFCHVDSSLELKEFTAWVPIWMGNSYVMQIRPIASASSEELKNERIKIQTTLDIRANENGCFCFPLGDERIALTTAFFYADEQIKFFNSYLESMSLPRMNPIELNLQRLRDIAPSGASGNGLVSLTYDSFIIDHSILAHEIGHEIHFQLMKMTPGEWQAACGSEKLEVIAQQTGVKEGVANILGALFLGRPEIGFVSYHDVPTDIDKFVSMKSPPLVRDVFLRRLQSNAFIKSFPITAKGYREALQNPELEKHLRQPDPYWASAVVTQPLWTASTAFGATKIIPLVLRSISGYCDFRSYADLANRLVVHAEGSIKQFLKRQYRNRKVF